MFSKHILHKNSFSQNMSSSEEFVELGDNYESEEEAEFSSDDDYENWDDSEDDAKFDPSNFPVSYSIKQYSRSWFICKFRNICI